MMKVIPARMGCMITDVDKVNDYMVAAALDTLDGISSINDAGNSGADKYTYKGVAGYDHKNDCILEVVVGADILPGGGKAICDSVIADVERLGISVPFIGSATDNATDVINAFVKHMQAIEIKRLSFYDCANFHCHFRRSI
jgi:hypothetical protein